MAWSYKMLLFSKDFETLIIKSSVISSRWDSRMTRVLFNYNARVGPSIIGYRKGCCGAQETSWMAIRASVIDYYSAVYSVLRKSLYDCPVVCY